EDTLHQNGLILLKQAPLPHARPQQSADDLHVEAGERITWLNHGTHETVHTGYQYAMLTYSGGRFGRIEALQRYQRQHRIFRPDDDIVFLSNTWGDRSQDGRIEESFLLQEIDACARLGVDVVQIDDGWQTGRTANSVDGNGVWNGFWAANASFWEANPTRLPHGLTPIVERAKAHGINVGLWFAPDSSDDFANWRRDADTLLNLYRDHGIRYFKIDGVKAFTKMAEKHLHAFFDTVLTDSHGDVMFDLDVTAEVRPGYFGLLHTGPLFVENRYTDWHRYWPHQTLRNLWQLSQVVDPRRLRIEMLNNTRNQQLYTDDPLAPVTYRPAYLFATTMFANPLGWFEASNLPDPYIEEVANLVGVWKQHRTAIFTGQMYPIGDVPDGTAWTGFASVAPDKQSGYLLIFREVNEQGTAVISLPMLQGTYDCSILGGHGNATLADGALNVSVPSEKDFAFIKFSIA
ncbi:MAG TPA: alpha-galactosidase, partial [Armatimonadota bacterium]|nr:alpha-galactosidase [Armatimonadota bacterium]